MQIIIITILSLVCFLCINGQRDRIEFDTTLTIDQVILRAMGGTNKVAQSLTMPDPDKRLAELDMVLTNKQYEALYAKQSTSGRKKRKAVRDETVYWPGARVPYKLAPGHFNDYERWMLKVSMREWEKYTCIRFHEAGQSDSNYVYFQDGLGCNSQLGMVGGSQALNLDKAGCRFKGLYLHEIAHALGVIHEHQRPNRDNYITILYENVEPSMRIWFQKYNEAAINSHNVDYELSSVMHYGVTAFSGNNKNTIKAIDARRENEIGQVYLKELSFTDIEIVNRMYKCVKSPDECGGKQCSQKGYLDQNCNCLCPDGSQDCTVGKTIDTSCRNNGDTRDSWNCYVWARQGECERNAGYMLSNCAKACGKCGDERKDPADTTICEDIYDVDEICKKWKEEVGDCRVAEPFMKKYCKKTCGYCNDFTLNREPPQTQCANAYANDTACEVWARQGECIVNDRWMPLNCRRACFTCEFDDRALVTVKPTGTTVTPQTTRPSTRPTVVTTQSTTRKPTDDCVNRYPDNDCTLWAKHNHCKINPTFMEANCMLACGVCQKTGTGVTVKPGGTDTMDNCKDTYKNPNDCRIWSEHQHCVINPSFMLKYCAKSCRSCTAGIREAASMIISESENGSSRQTIGAMSTIVLLLAVVVLT